MTNSTVVARMTVIRKLGVRTIVEVHADATFDRFYHFYTQDGRRRSTRKAIRTASRNEGMPYVGAHLMTAGLELLACRWATMQHVESVQVKILRKRAYRQLVHSSPSSLGQAVIRPFFEVKYPWQSRTKAAR
jgi:hypothetical protein